MGHTLSDNLFHGIILLEGVVSSAVWRLSYYWEKKERKKAQKYHINILIIMDPQRTQCSFQDVVFIIVIMLFSQPSH